MIDKYFCFRCNENIPTFHSSREEVNYKTKTHWFINYCPRCGTVTSVGKDTFNYSNLIPRIGRIKSMLFILLFSSPFLVIAWSPLGWNNGFPTGGIIVTPIVIGLACISGCNKIYEVENCVYERHNQYPELARHKETR